MAGTVQAGPLGSGALQSQSTKAPETPANLPNKDPEPDFIYFANPSRWDVYEWSDGTQELLPVLSKMKLDPGVGGVTETGDYSLARAARMRKGEIEIPRQYGENDYVQVLKVRKGTLYHERWRQFLRNGSQIVERTDTDGYLGFLRDVCAGRWPPFPAGLPVPLPEVLEGRQELYRAKLTRQVEAAGNNPLKTLSVEKTQEKIETLEAFKDGLEAGATTLPPKQGKQTLAQKIKGMAKGKKAQDATDVPDAEG